MKRSIPTTAFKDLKVVHQLVLVACNFLKVIRQWPNGVLSPLPLIVVI